MKYQINLFPPKEQNILDRIIYFSFHYLRYILVITQLVVIIVFFYRLKLDQEIIDKKDNLQQKKEIVLVSDPLLKKVEAVNAKSEKIQGLILKQDHSSNMLAYFLSNFPEGLMLSQFTLDDSKIVYSGIAFDVNLVKKYYFRLKKENKFKSVRLGQLTKKDDGYVFNFELAGFSP